MILTYTQMANEKVKKFKSPGSKSLVITVVNLTYPTETEAGLKKNHYFFFLIRENTGLLKIQTYSVLWLLSSYAFQACPSCRSRALLGLGLQVFLG